MATPNQLHVNLYLGTRTIVGYHSRRESDWCGFGKAKEDPHMRYTLRAIDVPYRLWQGVVIHNAWVIAVVTPSVGARGSRPASRTPLPNIQWICSYFKHWKAKFSNGSKRGKHSLRILAALTPASCQWGACNSTRVHQPKSIISWPSILGLNLEALLRLCPDLAVIEYIFQTDPLRAQNHEYPSGIVLGVIQQAKG